MPVKDEDTKLEFEFHKSNDPPFNRNRKWWTVVCDFHKKKLPEWYVSKSYSEKIKCSVKGCKNPGKWYYDFKRKGDK